MPGTGLDDIRKKLEAWPQDMAIRICKVLGWEYRGNTESGFKAHTEFNIDREGFDLVPWTDCLGSLLVKIEAHQQQIACLPELALLQSALNYVTTEQKAQSSVLVEVLEVAIALKQMEAPHG